MKKNKYIAKKSLKNKKMNNATFKQRREVMNIIYELKKHIDLPRIEVRVTENDSENHRLLGMGTMNKDTIIWICENSFKDKKVLKHVVTHEIGHAVFKLNHNKRCPVMKAIMDRPATNKEILTWIKSLKKENESCIAA